MISSELLHNCRTVPMLLGNHCHPSDTASTFNSGCSWDDAPTHLGRRLHPKYAASRRSVPAASATV
eukprot:1400615-Pyramimonas_sp.AAC.1